MLRRSIISLIFSLAVTGIAVGIFACSSGGLPGGQRLAICQGPQLDPFELPTNAQKQPIHFGGSSAHDKITLPANSDYGYSSVGIWYYDAARNIRIYFTEAPDPNTGVFTAQVFCLTGDGITPTMTALTDSFPFVSDIKTDQSGNLQIRKRIMTFTISKPVGPNDPWLKGPTVTAAPDLDYHPGSPLNTYDNSEFTTVDQYLIDTNLDNTKNNYTLAAFLQRPSDAPPKVNAKGIPVPPPAIQIHIEVALTLMTPDQRTKRDWALHHPPGPAAIPTPTPTSAH